MGTGVCDVVYAATEAQWGRRKLMQWAMTWLELQMARVCVLAVNLIHISVCHINLIHISNCHMCEVTTMNQGVMQVSEQHA